MRRQGGPAVSGEEDDPTPRKRRRTVPRRGAPRARRHGAGVPAPATPTATLVALKLVRSDLAADDVFRQRFEREARIARHVVNPHVVPVLDTGEHDGVPVSRAALHQRRLARGAARTRGPARAPRRPDPRRAGGRRARGARRRGARAPRRQAGERPARRGRDRLHHRLRPREGQPIARAHPARSGARLAALHGARADPRRRGQRRDRRVLARVRPVRVRERRAAVRGSARACA